MSLDIAGICSDTWNIVINVTEHWMGKSRKLEIAKCGMLLGKCYFAVHHKSNTEMLPLVTYTCCCFYAHEKGLKLRKPSSKLNNTTIIILVLVSSLLKGRVFLLTFKTTQNSKTTPYIKKKKITLEVCISLYTYGRTWKIWGYIMEDLKHFFEILPV